MKRMEIVLSLLALTIISILLPSPVNSLNVGQGQDDMLIVIERGQTHKFLLVLEDINHQGTIRFSGDIASWCGFGDNNEADYTIYPSLAMIIPVTITVAEDQELGEYDGEILLDDAAIARIRVKVTLELSDAKAYQKLSDVDREVGSLKDQVGSLSTVIGNLRSQITSLESEVNEKMDEIRQYQRNLTILESENAALRSEKQTLSQSLKSLQEKSDSLEESNKQLSELTGMMVSTEIPGMFFLGMVMGILCITLAVKKNSVAKRVKNWRQSLKRRKDRRIDYHFSP